jgi:putative ABC transport system substrate-binding protein
MMNRRAFIAGGGAALALPLAGWAQQAAEVYRIGIVVSGPPPAPPLIEPLKAHLRDLGWVEGQTLVIDHRFADGKIERLPGLLADLLRRGANVLVATDTEAAKAAQQSTKVVPIVVTSGDPVREGLVTSLAQPGGNITGLAPWTVDLRPKTLEFLTEMVPEASHIGFLMTRSSAQLQSWQNLQEVAPGRRVTMRRYEAIVLGDIERAFAAMRRDRLGGLIVALDPTFLSHHRVIVDLAAKMRVPVIYPNRLFVEAGGLVSYGHDYRYLGQLLADYVHRILKGASPRDLPIERPTKLELVVNLQAARALGVTIPPSLVSRADHVID